MITSESQVSSECAVGDVEAFLFLEAALLDEWRLDDWAALFTQDARYRIPSTDAPLGDPDKTLFLIDDDLTRIHGRVTRLKSRHAHREFPWSRTRRLITNVRILACDSAEVEVQANFLVARFRNMHADQFIGRLTYTLDRSEPGSFKIRARTAELDLETLGPFGAISIII